MSLQSQRNDEDDGTDDLALMHMMHIDALQRVYNNLPDNIQGGTSWNIEHLGLARSLALGRSSTGRQPVCGAGGRPQLDPADGSQPQG